MKKVQEQFRQGDVLIERIPAIPAGVKPVVRDAGRIVLAYGEVTGHAHAIADVNALLFGDGEDLYLEADGTVTLRHEEHAPIEIPGGAYRVTRQREYSPEAIRSVAD
jgi:hypothetical protein